MNLTLSDNHSLLNEKTSEFDFSNPPCDPNELAQELVRVMYEHKGLGLAANQCGLMYSVFAMRGKPHDFVCFNPRIVMMSDEQVLLEEACLSYPGLVVKVKRPKHLRMRFEGPDGQTYTQMFTGMTARCVLHEMMHLNGQVFYKKANRFHRDQAMRKWGK